MGWKKNDDFEFSECIVTNIALIAPAKMNETSRLLMKFVAKKRMATLSANYATIKNEKISHCIKAIGTQLYLVSIQSVKHLHAMQRPTNGAKNHCFEEWLKNENICNSLTTIGPPFFDANNKTNVMQFSECKDKQFISSSFMDNISSQLLPVALEHIGKELTAKVIAQSHETFDPSNDSANHHPNQSLFDMYWGSE